MLQFLIYGISTYLLVGMLIGLNTFSVDKQYNQLLPVREYSVRIPIFWLIDIIFQVFFNYEQNDNNQMGV